MSHADMTSKDSRLVCYLGYLTFPFLSRVVSDCVLHGEYECEAAEEGDGVKCEHRLDRHEVVKQAVEEEKKKAHEAQALRDGTGGDAEAPVGERTHVRCEPAEISQDVA